MRRRRRVRQTVQRQCPLRVGPRGWPCRLRRHRWQRLGGRALHLHARPGLRSISREPRHRPPDRGAKLRSRHGWRQSGPRRCPRRQPLPARRYREADRACRGRRRSSLRHRLRDPRSCAGNSGRSRRVCSAEHLARLHRFAGRSRLPQSQRRRDRAVGGAPHHARLHPGLRADRLCQPSRRDARRAEGAGCHSRFRPQPGAARHPPASAEKLAELKAVGSKASSSRVNVTVHAKEKTMSRLLVVIASISVAFLAISSTCLASPADWGAAASGGPSCGKRRSHARRLGRRPWRRRA